MLILLLHQTCLVCWCLVALSLWCHCYDGGCRRCCWSLYGHYDYFETSSIVVTHHSLLSLLCLSFSANFVTVNAKESVRTWAQASAQIFYVMNGYGETMTKVKMLHCCSNNKKKNNATAATTMTTTTTTTTHQYKVVWFFLSSSLARLRGTTVTSSLSQVTRNVITLARQMRCYFG